MWMIVKNRKALVLYAIRAPLYSIIVEYAQNKMHIVAPKTQDWKIDHERDTHKQDELQNKNMRYIRISVHNESIFDG